MSIEEAILASGGSIKISVAKSWEKPTSANRRIRERIQELSDIAQKNAILRTGLNREWVISRLMTVANRCMQIEPVTKMVNGELIETGEFTFDSRGANTALRSLGDIIGLFKPVDTKPGDEFSHLSDDDLRKIATELAGQVGLLPKDCNVIDASLITNNTDD